MTAANAKTTSKDFLWGGGVVNRVVQHHSSMQRSVGISVHRGVVRGCLVIVRR